MSLRPTWATSQKAKNNQTNKETKTRFHFPGIQIKYGRSLFCFVFLLSLAHSPSRGH